MASARDQVFLAAWYLCCVLLLGTAVPAGKRLNNVAGPYVGFIDRWDQCDPAMTDGTMAIYLKPNQRRHQRETQYFTGNATLLENLDDTFWLTARVEAWSNNRWRQDDFVIHKPTKACSQFVLNIPDISYKLFNQTYNPKQECVVRKGVYSVENTYFNFTFPASPVFFYGRFRFIFTIGQKKVTKLCCKAIADVLPQL